MSACTPLRILCVDDHPVVRAGIATMFEGQDRFRLVATAASGAEAIAQFQEHRPDITLMDLRLPDMNGSEVISRIRERWCQARIIALTTYAGDFQAHRALKAGAMGYLLKSSLRTELFETIEVVHAGRRRITQEVAANMSEFLLADALTEREVQILKGVSSGSANREIAVELRISEETVRGHLKNVFLKLRANDRTHAVVIALQRGILAI